MASESSNPPRDAQTRLERMVPRYIERRLQDLEALLDGVARGDFKRVCAIAHQIKGSGAGYGFPFVTEVAAAIERAARHQDPAEARRQISDLRLYLLRVRPTYSRIEPSRDGEKGREGEA